MADKIIGKNRWMKELNKRNSYSKNSLRTLKCSCGGIVFLLLMVGITPLLQANITGMTHGYNPNDFFAVNTPTVIPGYPRIIPSQNNLFQNEEWNQTFGRTNIDVGYCVKQTADSGYILSRMAQVAITSG